jgi:squalene-hopene/tetraprenyl-beta-curcumene cyclase
VNPEQLESAIATAERALLDRQRDDGHWIFELEAGATVSAEYIMLEHYLDEIDPVLEAKIGAYLRRIQNADGGWPLFHQGDSEIGATVSAYYALKLAGEQIDAPHMRRARERALALGGAARCAPFTRVALALFGQVPWRAIPVAPVEIMLMPRWFPLRIERFASWTRTVLVPLLILTALHPRARNPRKIGVRELFVTPPEREAGYMRSTTATPLGRVFLAIDALLRKAEPCFSKALRRLSIERAVAFTTERLNGEDGLGAIFPAIVNSVIALDALGYAPDHPYVANGKRAIRKLLVEREREAYCRPCVSPVWDTALAVHALLESGSGETRTALACANAWLAGRQVLDTAGDWAARRPRLRPGGWAFQYRNDHYPDLDDTAVVAMALDREDATRYRAALERVDEWVLGMQSRNGGWAAYDADNAHTHLDHIPFADHGALLDPPSEDITARCIGYLLQRGYRRDHASVARGLDYLRTAQQSDGSWFGRWGTNYVYGTWAVLSALAPAGENASNSEPARRAVEFLLRAQQSDGGWGEDGRTYWNEHRGLCQASTASQTAWALLGLMAAGEVAAPAVPRGVRFLLETRNAGGLWDEEWFTAVGVPRFFYLRYDGYRTYFPLMALARYRNLTQRGQAPGRYGF